MQDFLFGDAELTFRPKPKWSKPEPEPEPEELDSDEEDQQSKLKKKSAKRAQQEQAANYLQVKKQQQSYRHIVLSDESQQLHLQCDREAAAYARCSKRLHEQADAGPPKPKKKRWRDRFTAYVKDLPVAATEASVARHFKYPLLQVVRS